MIFKNNDEKVINKIRKSLESEGIPVGPIVINAIISEYLKVKRDVLSNGDSFIEEGIGRMYPSWRRLSANFSEKRFTSLIKCEVDGNLKDSMNDELLNNINYAEKVDALDIFKGHNELPSAKL